MGEIKDFTIAKKESNLENSWNSIFDKFGANKNKSKEIFNNILEAYEAKDRHYHNLNHIKSLLEFIGDRKDQIKDYDALIIAAWFHDVVYNTRTRDNEEKSAVFAREALENLGIPEEIIKKAEGLIIATSKHENPTGENDYSIFLDGDLAILGSDIATYDNYAKAIRQEYSWVSEEQYKQGRKQVLENFLKRERIYFTEETHGKFEARARENIMREITSLS